MVQANNQHAAASMFSSVRGLAPIFARYRSKLRSIEQFVEGDLLIGSVHGRLQTAMVFALADGGALMLPMPDGGEPFWVPDADVAHWQRPLPAGARLVEVIDGESEEIAWATYAPDLHSAIALRTALSEIRPDLRVIIETPYEEELNYLDFLEGRSPEQTAPEEQDTPEAQDTDVRRPLGM
jgi:hypothetical protein